MYRLGILLLLFIANPSFALMPGFVYLQDVAAGIVQEMRYAGEHNFVGRPIRGYQASKCILTQEAAVALSKVQAELQTHGMTLKVYDCYRPTMAVADFIFWSHSKEETMKAEFYPATNKTELFKLGYIATKSGHSRGSTIDLTIIPIPAKAQPPFRPGQRLVACTSDYEKRYQDNSIDMGTGYDCMDPLAAPLNREVTATAFANRLLLRNLMMKNGFEPYDKEWWHFTLKNEPYHDTYFNFAVR